MRCLMPLLLLTLSLSGCGDGGNAPTGIGETPDLSYFPLVDGASWSYRATSRGDTRVDPEVVAITSETDEEGETLYRIYASDHFFDLGDEEGYIRLAEGELVIAEERTRTDERGQLLESAWLEWPILREPVRTGATWNRPFRTAGRGAGAEAVEMDLDECQTCTFEILSVHESVEVPAGHFRNAVHVRFFIPNDWELHYYLVRGVGIVRLAEIFSPSPEPVWDGDPAGLDYVLELVEYQIP